MASLQIIKPAPIFAIQPPAAAFLATPDPKEAAALASAFYWFDLGAPTTIDTVFLGYHNATGAQYFSVSTPAAMGVAPADGEIVKPVTPFYTGGRHQPYSAVARFPATSARYWAIGLSAPVVVGVAAFGLAFQPAFGHEYGSGRFVGDTGTANRLRSGGFGIDPGVTFAGWQWTMGDLTDDEVEQLFSLQKGVGSTRSLLVIEDPDDTPGLNERLHWGIMTKLEAYERIAPGATRWAMTIGDWA